MCRVGHGAAHLLRHRAAHCTSAAQAVRIHEPRKRLVGLLLPLPQDKVSSKVSSPPRLTCTWHATPLTRGCTQCFVARLLQPLRQPAGPVSSSTARDHPSQQATETPVSPHVAETAGRQGGRKARAAQAAQARHEFVAAKAKVVQQLQAGSQATKQQLMQQSGLSESSITRLRQRHQPGYWEARADQASLAWAVTQSGDGSRPGRQPGDRSTGTQVCCTVCLPPPGPCAVSEAEATRRCRPRCPSGTASNRAAASSQNRHQSTSCSLGQGSSRC